MSRIAEAIGVVVARRLTAGLIADHTVIAHHGLDGYAPAALDPQMLTQSAPEETTPGTEGYADDNLSEVPASVLCEMICDRIAALAPTPAAGDGAKRLAIGIAVPGIIRDGTIEDAPNVPQLKGAHLGLNVQSKLAERGLPYRVSVFNDADAVAAGVAATQGWLGDGPRAGALQPEKVIRVWTIGNGIGYGRFPYTGGPWEGGHTVVTLDPKENYCGCGGRGHLEGIMGHRAMRLRFLDMEPDEVFAAAREGDKRCTDFVELWHRALAAATATQIHLEGPGRFYYTGRDIQRLDLARLQRYLDEMVKMSPLQSSTLEVLPEDRSLAVIGAGVAAAHAQR